MATLSDQSRAYEARLQAVLEAASARLLADPFDEETMAAYKKARANLRGLYRTHYGLA